MTPLELECNIYSVVFITSSIFWIKEILEVFTKAIGFEAFLWASMIWFLGMLVIWYNWPA